MNSFYLWSMRSASVLLFVMAIATIVGTIGYLVAAHIEAAVAQQTGLMSMTPRLSVSQLIFPIISSLGSASLPLFGAAVLWRADRWIARQGAEAAE